MKISIRKTLSVSVFTYKGINIHNNFDFVKNIHCHNALQVWYALGLGVQIWRDGPYSKPSGVVTSILNI